MNICIHVVRLSMQHNPNAQSTHYSLFPPQPGNPTTSLRGHVQSCCLHSQILTSAVVKMSGQDSDTPKKIQKRVEENDNWTLNVGRCEKQLNSKPCHSCLVSSQQEMFKIRNLSKVAVNITHDDCSHTASHQFNNVWRTIDVWSQCTFGRQLDSRDHWFVISQIHLPELKLYTCGRSKNDPTHHCGGDEKQLLACEQWRSLMRRAWMML